MQKVSPLKISDSRLLYAAAGLGALGLGLGLTMYRKPLTILEWSLRRYLRLSGLRQQIMPYHQGQLSYFYSAKGSGSSKAPVMLVHGLGGHGGNWFHTVKELRDRELYVVDLPGHGDSRLEGLVWSSETIFEIFTLLVEEATGGPKKQGRKMVLVGNSMGGWLSILYALTFPERVEKLILVNSAGQRFDVNRRYFVPESREDAQRIVDAIFGKESKRLPGFILDAMIRRSMESPSASALDHAAHAAYIDDHLEDLQVPTEVIWGTGDTMLPITHAYQFEEKIPDVRLHLMAGAGHSPQVGSPEAFNRLLRQVID